MGRIHQDAQSAYFDRYPTHRKIVQPFLQGFDVTYAADRVADVKLDGHMLFLKPEPSMAELLGLEREVLLVYSPHREFQARTLEFHEKILSIFSTRLDPAL